jgi:branched-chain amino acid transport system substrate-binding protein
MRAILLGCRALCWCLGLATILALGCRSAREVRIAVVGPLTGEQAEKGKEVLEGVSIAVEEWNAHGGVRGRKVILVSADDENLPQKAAEVAYFISKQSPRFVVGHVDSGCSMAAAKIYQDRQVLMISPTSTNPKLTEMGLPGVFRVCGRDDAQGKAAAVWCMKHDLGGRVAVVHDNSDYGYGLAKEFIRNYEFLSGGKVLLDETVARDLGDMKPVAAKCKEAGVGLVYFGGLHPQGAALLRELRAAKADALFMSGDGCFGQEFIDAAGKELAEGALVTFYPDLAALPEKGAQAFRQSYTERYGKGPGPFAIFGYIAANTGLTAISKAVTPIRDETIRDALHRLTFDTPYGEMRFNDKGDPTEMRYTVWTVRGGSFGELGS